MATCHSCGAKVNGQYCNTCGARVQEEKAPKKPPKPDARGGLRGGAAVQANRIWRSTAIGLLGLAIFAGGLVTGFYLGTEDVSSISAASLPEDLGIPEDTDLPPIAIAGRYMDKGVAFMEQGERSAAVRNFRKAIAYYKQVLAQEPDNLYARTYLGLTYYYVGDSDRALKLHREVLDQDPNYLWAIFNLAWIYQTADKKDESLQMYRKYLDVVEEERQDRVKYAEQYELIDRQITAARKALEAEGGGDQ